MGFGQISVLHLVALPLVLLSFFLYVYIVIKILHYRRHESSLFRTPFFTLVLGQAFWDLSMFLVAFILVFCRRYLLYPHPELQDGFFSKAEYFLQTVFTNCMYMSSVLYALSRMTAFKWPSKQDTIWTSQNIFYAMVVIGIISSINVGRLFIGDHSVTLQIISPGRMRMFQDPSLIEQDSYQDLVLSGGCSVICCVIYCWAGWRSKFLGFKGNMRYQRKFLLCAITTFLPYIPNAIKSYLLIYAGATQNDLLTYYCIEAWLFVIYLMCLVQPWVLLFTYPRIRPIFGPDHGSESSRSFNRTPVEHSSRQNKTPSVITPIV